MTSYVLRGLRVGLLSALALNGLLAQQSVDVRSWTATRTQLTTELERLQGLAQSPAYGSRIRERAAREATAIQQRLARGDFQAGDRFTLEVSGTVVVSDTLTVPSSGRVQVPSFGEVDVSGVLLTELEDVVRRHVVESVRDAAVTVRPLVRIAVFGAVTTPGYQSIPLETRLDALLSGAGGPSADADPSNLRVLRGDEVLLRGADVLEAIADGATLGSLGLREGDYLSVSPRPPPWDRAATLSIITIITGPLLAFLLVR